jgi:uncharacterized protein YjbI with pentapeptide repeats
MANQEHLDILKQGVYVWNQWREENPKILPDLSNVDFTDANLIVANLQRTDLRDANLWRATLNFADFSYADLSGTQLNFAELRNTYFKVARFVKTKNLRNRAVAFSKP